MAKLPVGPSQTLKNHCILGPHRVFPGRLSVSRTFGDIEAKSPALGGNPNVVVSDPDVIAFEVTKDYDFIALGCDGIFDKMTSKDCMKKVWDSIQQTKSSNVHTHAGEAVELILRHSVACKTLDNITAVVVCFSNFKEAIALKNDGKAIEIPSSDTGGA